SLPIVPPKEQGNTGFQHEITALKSSSKNRLYMKLKGKNHICSPKPLLTASPVSATRKKSTPSHCDNLMFFRKSPAN
ncbi:MAG: hypothetical protein ACFFDJ_09595, partial [Candidatus Odinarchaeota archaeon]